MGNPLSTRDHELATPYLLSVVEVPDYPYGTVLLDIYDDCFVTSAGYTKWITLPAEPVQFRDYDGFIIMDKNSISELPANFQKFWVLALDSEDILLEAKEPLFDAILNMEDLTPYLTHIAEVDYTRKKYVTVNGYEADYVLVVFQ